MMQDIHGIRPPVMVGTDPAVVTLALVTGGCAAAIAILFLVIRYILKKTRSKQIHELIPAVSAYDRAVTDLDRMAAASAQDSKAFYFGLGHTVKAYMGAVFSRNCLEMTTPELSRAVKEFDLPQALIREIIRFQEVCDPFRYAPVAPGPDQIQADLARAKALVDSMENQRIRQGQEETP
jgi:hypothetical protein